MKKNLDIFILICFIGIIIAVFFAKNIKSDSSIECQSIDTFNEKLLLIDLKSKGEPVTKKITGVCTCHTRLICLYSTGICNTPCSINL